MQPEEDNLTEYQRHRDFSITPVHIVDRLHGSIPVKVLSRYQEEIKARIREINKKAVLLPESQRDKFRKIKIREAKSKYGDFIEDALHGNSNGPYHLSDPKIAQLVIEAWKYQMEARNLVVIAVCVMSNHVHALVRGPDSGEVLPAGLIMNSIKSYTARQANRILNRTGSPFWAPYFDRYVREGAFMTVLWYIVNNPVKERLVPSWKDWPHTYMNPEYIDLLG